MTGTWVNAGAILLGALIGCLLKKGIPQHINSAIMKTEGLAIGIIALNGIIASMFRAGENGRLSDSDGLVLLVSLVLGCLVGELLKINDRLEGFGLAVEKRLGAGQGFAKGLVSASLVFCVGAMSVIGPLNDGLTGDSSVLLVKSTLDFTTSIVLASALGIGVLFSVIPVVAIQGSVALLAGFLSPFVTERLLDLFCMVGYAIVLCIGLNFLLDAKIKTANLLPALAGPVVYYFLLA